MKAVKRWFRNWLQEDSQIIKDGLTPDSLRGSFGSTRSTVNHDFERASINFRVIHARGGKIVEATCYDPTTDRTTTSLYIIGDEVDFSEELGKIVTLESLR